MPHGFTHCEFGHLVTHQHADLGTVRIEYVAHVHEDEALTCAQYETAGWPQPNTRLTIA